MCLLKAVDYAKVEHDFKMFELVLNSISPDVCDTDMPVVILLNRNIAPPHSLIINILRTGDADLRF